MRSSGVVDAIATAPVNKEAFRLAGLPWSGHTDLLAHLTGRAARRDDVLFATRCASCWRPFTFRSPTCRAR